MKILTKKAVKIKSCRFFAVLLTVAILLCYLPAVQAATDSQSESSGDIWDAADKELDDNTLSYATYIREHSDKANPKQSIMLSAEQAEIKSGNAEMKTDYENDMGQSLYMPEESEAFWQFYTEESGMYILRFKYYPAEGEGSPIQLRVLLNGELPFHEAGSISLERLWTNQSGALQFDAQGNQMMVNQVEIPEWTYQYAWDPSGFQSTPLQFYLPEGNNTIVLQGLREPLALKYLEFLPVSEFESEPYKKVEAGYGSAKLVSENAVVKLQGEDADVKSDQTMYPLADRSSPTVEPYDSNCLRYNTIGGNQWTTSGQWIEWSFNAPETGLYTLSAHFKQSLKDSQASVREVYIDGKLPFSEAAAWSFDYSGAWQTCYFADEDDNPYKFYLEEGSHTIRLRVGLGYYSEILSLAQELLTELNSIYRQIVAVSGTSPDVYRDYHFDTFIPETIDSMKTLSKRLKQMEADVTAKSPENGTTVGDIQRLYIQLDMMTDDTETISRRLVNFKSNIASFGTWINQQMGQPLEIDWLCLSGADYKLPRGEAGLLGLAGHYIKQFLSSFVMDYSTIGVSSETANTSIRVWMTTGRDQSQILQQLVLGSFTPQYDIAANIQLVSANALLPAVLADCGPDVALGLAQTEPMNLALRSGILDLSKMDGIEDVKQEFYDYTLEPFEWNNGLWALPETQTFPMLFYRKDILDELNISINDLRYWDTLLGTVLPQLQKNSLTFGIMPTIQNYLSLCYQYGGTVYDENNTVSGLSSSQAIESMQRFSMLYTQYGLPLTFDFANRFRNGEMPVAIADFTQYNTLTMFAPEIRGQWSMLPVPGTLLADGSTSHAAINTVTGCVILADTEHPDAAWSFLRWWISAETQSSFGKQLESVVGAAARYNTANRNAMASVQWDSDIGNSLRFQSEHLCAFPEVPGGYFTARLYDFAFRNIVYDAEDVRENMNNTAEDINRELLNKRREYGIE